jgi:hypothetical protein
MPVVINSPDFEPDSEREGLILSGPDRDQIRSVPTECGINRIILRESVRLFDMIVSYLWAEHHELYFLLKGLQEVPSGLRSFDPHWFHQNIILGYRAVLKKYPIVETPIGRLRLFRSDGKPHILFVKADDDDPSGTLYSLFRDCYGCGRLTRWELNAHWAEFAWSECGVVTMHYLCRHIRDCGTVAQLKDRAILGFDEYAWLNALFRYLQSSPVPKNLPPGGKSRSSPRISLISSDCAIIPNCDNVFLSLNTPGIAVGQGLTPVMLDTLARLGDDLSKRLVHPAIDSLSPNTIKLTVNAEALSQLIDRNVTAITKSYTSSGFFPSTFSYVVGRIWPILRIVSTHEKYPVAFRDRQRKVVKFMSSIHDRSEPALENDDLYEIAWSEAHKWSITQLARYVADSRSIEALRLRLRLENVQETVEWIDDVFGFLRHALTGIELGKLKIIPNQLGDFCLVSGLCSDELPPIFRTDPSIEFGFDWRPSLIHPGIRNVVPDRKKTIDDVSRKIDDIFLSGTQLSQYDTLRCALFLAHVLPHERSQRSREERNVSMKVLGLLAAFFPTEIRSFKQTTIDQDLPHAWRAVLRYCMEQILAKIKRCSTLREVGLLIHPHDPVQCLKNVFEVMPRFGQMRGNIYPNELGEFCELKSLWKPEEIPDDLKTILLDLSEEKQDIRRELIDGRFQSYFPDMQPKRVSDICGKIDNIVEKIWQSPRKKEEKFRRPIKAILSDWIRERPDAEILFPFISKEQRNIRYEMLDPEMQESLLELSERPEDVRKLRSCATSLAEREKREAELREKAEKLQKEIEYLKRKSEHSNRESAVSETASGPFCFETEIRNSIQRFKGLVGESHVSDALGQIFMSLTGSYLTGALGEAAVFRDLQDNGVFRSVVWHNQSSDPTEDSFQGPAGETIYWANQGTTVDINTVTEAGLDIPIEVKATFYSPGTARMNFYLGQGQLDVFAKASLEHPAVLAIVQDAKGGSPTITYLTLFGGIYLGCGGQENVILRGPRVTQ